MSSVHIPSLNSSLLIFCIFILPYPEFTVYIFFRQRINFIALHNLEYSNLYILPYTPYTKKGRPIGRPVCILAAAAVIVAAAVVALISVAAQAVVATATEQDEQDDDPANVTAAETVIIHKNTSIFSWRLSSLIPRYSAA